MGEIMSALNKKIEIWLPDQHEIILPSPYLITPISRMIDPSCLASYQGSPTCPLPILMDELYFCSPQELKWEGITMEVLFKLRRNIVIEFWRSEMDSKLPHARPPRPARKHVYAEVDIWRSVLQLAERLSTLGLISDPVLTLGSIIKERKLTLFNFLYSEKNPGATKLLRECQTENRQLQALQNPFSPDYAPKTCEVLDKAVLLAGAMPGNFSKNFYMKVVKARMGLVTVLKEQNARSYLDGKQEKRGRKKTSF